MTSNNNNNVFEQRFGHWIDYSSLARNAEYRRVLCQEKLSLDPDMVKCTLNIPSFHPHQQPRQTSTNPVAQETVSSNSSRGSRGSPRCESNEATDDYNYGLTEVGEALGRNSALQGLVVLPSEEVHSELPRAAARVLKQTKQITHFMTSLHGTPSPQVNETQGFATRQEQNSGNSCMSELSSALRYHPSLQRVTVVSPCPFPSPVFEEALWTIPHLERFEIRMNRRKTEHRECQALALTPRFLHQASTNLKNLHLDESILSKEHVAALCQGMVEPASLPLVGNSPVATAKSGLVTLALTNNVMLDGSHFCQSLAQAFLHCDSLRAFRWAPAFKVFDLDSKPSGNVSQEIGQALGRISRLKELDFSMPPNADDRTPTERQQWSKLLAATGESPSLKILTLKNFEWTFSSRQADPMSDALARVLSSTPCSYLHLEKGLHTSEDWLRVATAISSSTSRLKTFTVEFNNAMGTKCALKGPLILRGLEGILQANPNLYELNVTCPCVCEASALINFLRSLGRVAKNLKILKIDFARIQDDHPPVAAQYPERPVQEAKQTTLHSKEDAIESLKKVTSKENLGNGSEAENADANKQNTCVSPATPQTVSLTHHTVSNPMMTPAATAMLDALVGNYSLEKLHGRGMTYGFFGINYLFFEHVSNLLQGVCQMNRLGRRYILQDPTDRRKGVEEILTNVIDAHRDRYLGRHSDGDEHLDCLYLHLRENPYLCCYSNDSFSTDRRNNSISR